MVTRSTFAGIEIGKTGLFMSQKGLDVTGHNIANSDTLGYTRQRLINTAIDPASAIYKLKPPAVQGLVGGGSRVMILDQIRDSYLDRQFRTEYTNYSYWGTRVQSLTYLETYFDTDDTMANLSSVIQGFFDSWTSLSQDSASFELRTNVLQSAQSMITYLQTTYNGLLSQLELNSDAIATNAAEANSILEQIADLNYAIYRYEMGGEQANDLRDKRNLLLDELSQYMDITYHEDNSGYMHVYCCGEEMVSHDSVTTRIGVMQESFILPSGQRITVNYPELNGRSIVDYSANRHCGGILGSLYDMVRSEDADLPGIPYFLNQLDTLAVSIMKEVNSLLADGYTYSYIDETGAVIASKEGRDFDPLNPTQPETFFAGDGVYNMRLIDELLDEKYGAWNIPISSNPVNLEDPDPETGNNEIAKAVAELFERENLAGILSIQGFISSITTDLTTKLKYAKDTLSTRSLLISGIDSQRTSISGVSLDEEMTNIIKYQHAYSGASRVITAMDEALETLINKMGIVGRS